VAKLEFDCPMCHGAVETALDTAGAVVTCPHCGKPVRAPSPQNQSTMVRVQAVPTSSLAVWSFILGLASIFCFGVITGIPAIFCGHMALGRIKRADGALGGSGLAIAGLIIAYISLAGWAIIVLFFGGLAFLASLTDVFR